ncbi:M48 family metallopeptidase [Psychromarinibacter halotolerans]|uniref:M48 family metallopeptidase n=1 Tax=Psychromarinibacter halotolerans TaxID=1775175 RepID=A0ABV7GYP1_9RHOB|nr:M48 family metallopeptidase [Psychromarinibacter halotolerans]MDF0596386.1 M48 family metallopeptidase [Psychromarinibacter halotolerans]
MFRIVLPLFCVLLSACTLSPPAGIDGPSGGVFADDKGALSPAAGDAQLGAVVARTLPVAEQVCRAERIVRNCDFVVLLDADPSAPPNAFQTEGPNGEAVLIVTAALLAEMRNEHELAFVLGHEAAHHILGHIPKARESAARGAVLAAVLAEMSGLQGEDLVAVQSIGAELGVRGFAKTFELEADALGTVIAARSGYDPLTGVLYFDRIDDPGNVFLGTHPPNSERIDVVRRVAAGL